MTTTSSIQLHRIRAELLFETDSHQSLKNTSALGRY